MKKPIQVVEIQHIWKKPYNEKKKLWSDNMDGY